MRSVLALVACLVGCHSTVSPRATAPSRNSYAYVGMGSWDGTEPGRIAVYRVEDDRRLALVQRVEVGRSAAFMAADRARHALYVADESGRALRRFTIDPKNGHITQTAELAVPGAPVYVALDARGGTLLTASYDEGVVRLFALDDESGPVTATQTERSGVETHSVVLSADEAYAYACNKGSSTIAQFAFDRERHTLTALTPKDVPHPGGPRHAALSEDGRFLFVVSELEDTVRTYAIGRDGQLDHLADVARLPAGERGSGAHARVTGAHLYVSNREPSNSLAVYRIEQAGQLTLVEHEASAGATPRHFDVNPEGDLLVAGNQGTQTAVVFSIDPVSGALEHRHTFALEGSPFFVGLYTFP
jgi:6-phosphogluconolactonase